MSVARQFDLRSVTIAFLVTIVSALAVSAQSLGPVRTVENVDLSRYVGDWFEIARFPNRFQRQCVGDVRASYVRRSDGIDVINRCRATDGTVTEARGIARVVDERTSAKLKVRFAAAVCRSCRWSGVTTGSSVSPLTTRGRSSGRLIGRTFGFSLERRGFPPSSSGPPWPRLAPAASTLID